MKTIILIILLLINRLPATQCPLPSPEKQPGIRNAAERHALSPMLAIDLLCALPESQVFTPGKKIPGAPFRNIAFDRLLKTIDDTYRTADTIRTIIELHYPNLQKIYTILEKQEQCFGSAWLSLHQEEVMLVTYGFLRWLNEKKRLSGYGISEEDILPFTLAARFHDIGKTAVPTQSMMDMRVWTAEQKLRFATVHTERGGELLCRVAQQADALVPEPLYHAVWYHHENFIGNGRYCLRGKAIPLIGRIVRITDSLSAMLGNRPYPNENGKSFYTALRSLQSGKTTAYDPELLNDFIEFIREADRSVHFVKNRMTPQNILLPKTVREYSLGQTPVTQSI